ncbi:MAG: hypothetical protein L6R45_34510 [Anaerolineae bacterium]|nr:hypothetical protein [Anaerolineae bacterium]
MKEAVQLDFTPQELDQLQQVRLSVLAFQRAIATLPADEYNEARSEQFNQIWLEAKAILNEPDFDKKIPRAMTKDLLAERSQRVIMSRLSGIVMFGVILALLGLGVNSIILDDFIINSLGCLVSTGGMLLIIGAFVVWAVNSMRGRVSNLGDLYLSSNALLVEIENVLNLALPGWAERATGEGSEIPSAVDLALDSLRKQAADWQHKLRELEQQQLSLGAAAPLELKLNLDFSQRELQRVRQEIDRLQGRPGMGLKANIIVPPGVGEVITDPPSLRRAKSVTMDMPVSRPEEADPPETEAV